MPRTWDLKADLSLFMSLTLTGWMTFKQLDFVESSFLQLSNEDSGVS